MLLGAVHFLGYRCLSKGRRRGREFVSAACPAPAALSLARAGQGPRGAHHCLEIACSNSPECWRLFVEEKPEERRKRLQAQTSLPVGGPESLSDGVALVSAFRFVQPTVLAMGELWKKADLEL